MIKTIFLHELKNILMSPKFTAAFVTCSLLLLLSVFIGIEQYKKSVRQYDTVTSLSNQAMREQKDWMGLSAKAQRKPEPMQIFVTGVGNDIGRYSDINSVNGVKLIHSNYSDDPIYALFRLIDFAFIVTFVFSLLAILFTYDLINGEKEKGTLQLVLSNAIPRSSFIIGKLSGAWAGLVVPALVPILLCILFILFNGIPFTNDDWTKLLILIFVSLMLFTFFIILGTFISASFKRSSVSFLLSLVIWICFVFIIPRAGVLLAGQIIRVPGVAEIEGQQDGYAKDRWNKYMNESSKRWEIRNKGLENLSGDLRQAYRDEHMWQWLEEEDNERKKAETEIDKYAGMLQEDLRNRKSSQERLAFLLSRISPVSAYQLAAMSIAGTDIKLKDRYEDAMKNYRNEFNKYKENKRKQSGDIGGIRITVDSESGFKLDVSRDKGTLDLSDMPKFEKADFPISKSLESSVMDIASVVFFTILAFGAAFCSFLKFDVR